MRRLLTGLALAAVCVGVAGCGGSSDPASEIQANREQMLAAVKADNAAKACSYVDGDGRGECIAAFAMAKALLGGSMSDLASDGEWADAEKDVESSTIRVAEDGKRATVTSKDDEPESWVRVDGEWKLVWDD